MAEFIIAPDPRPTGRDATRDYVLDIVEQLARMARKSGETRIAILLEAILATEVAPRRAG